MAMSVQQPAAARAAAAAPAARRAARSAPRRAAPRAAHGMTSAPPVVDTELVNSCVNAIRFLAIDGVEKAASGHPGLPMGAAPMAYLLWNEYMKFNPQNPDFFNRDRFVLSAGHGSMLQYGLLHLAGFPNVTTEDLKQFRQLNSCTPGHPENFVTPGVEVTTGPLGMGIAMAVGLAGAEKHLAARFNKPDCELVDHYTYVIMGDGCNQEGISNEAASFAGHQGMGKLIALYDDNKITIDGHTDISFTEDVCARYEALGWHVQHVEDGNCDMDGLRKAIDAAKAVTDKPSLIKVTTIIGYGSPNKANSHDVHGAALGADEVQATRDMLKWEHEPFVVPEDVKAAFDHTERGAAEEAAWNATLADYESKYPEDAAEFKQLISRELPEDWESSLDALDYSPGNNEAASRIHSQSCLNALATTLPGLIGGSADLAPSNMTLMKMFGDFQKDTPEERNVRFGVREHAMGAIANGFALHKSGLVPYCATFFIFSDYMRSAMRMSALSEIGTIHVMTHDSIGLGEDGPTHQPVEHLASFRAMPNMYMMRPGDGNETVGMYKVAVKSRNTPSTLALSRQKLTNLPGTSVEKAMLGAYTVSDNTPEGETPDAIIIGTGSELENAYNAAETVRAEGKNVRCVSMPCWELFDAQSAEYQEEVLPAACTARVSIEAGSTMGWGKYIGTAGKAVGIDTFGASAPAGQLYEKFGITTETAVEALKSVC